MANHLKKINKEAARLVKLHPGMSYRSAQKKAGAKFKGKKPMKVAGRKKQARTRAKKIGEVYRPVNVEHFEKVGKVSGTDVRKSLAHSRALLTNQLGWLVATQTTAKTSKEKKALSKRIAEIKAQLKALK